MQTELKVSMSKLLNGYPWPATHVANAYGKDIFAQVVGDRSHIISISIPQGGVGRAKEYASNKGFTRIAPGSHFKFEPECEGTVYVSIFGDDGRKICQGTPIPQNHSVIVSRDGYLKRTKMGTIWTDTEGEEH